jgi:outer membrane cobalamin receptor
VKRLSTVALWLLLAPGVAAGAPADTTAPDSVSTRRALASAPFDVTAKTAYLRRHSYSFDHYLQYEPGIVLVRRGPIGSDVAFSRLGIGRGRGLVVFDGIVLNDPQNDVAPVVHVPVSGLAVVRGPQATGRGTASTMAIEGVVEVDELAPPRGRPRTFLELSKGNNELRQRRVRFSSADGPVGVDVGFDELLNSGYAFDAREEVGINVPGFGETTSRQYSVRLRGSFEDGNGYSMYFREFESTSQGDLVSPRRAQRRGGYVASARLDLARVDVRVFERGYKVDYPDSETVNQTTAAYASASLLEGERRSVVVEAGFEDITSVQRVGGARSSPTLAKTVASVETVERLAGGLVARAYATGTNYHDVVTQWGGGLDVQRAWPVWRLGAGVARSYRMPNLGELYLPEHRVGSRIVSGNESLDAEYAWEAGANAGVTWGPVTNEVRGSAIRVKDPVDTRARIVGGDVRLAPANTGGALLFAVEERLRLTWNRLGLRWVVEGAGEFTGGDRVGYFASTPRTRLHARARFGRKLFDATSALFAGVRYTYSDARVDFSGEEMPAYGVVDFTLDGRLLDADMYLALLNAFDERYRTDGDHLMTPRTFVYGISWTLWE